MDRYAMICKEVKAATYHLLAEQCAGLAPNEKLPTMLGVASIALFEAVKELAPDERTAALDLFLSKHEIVLGMLDRGEL